MNLKQTKKIKNEIKKLGPKQMEEKEVGFGVKYVEVMFVVPDQEGEKFEDELKKIDGVASVETSGITLV